jgi:hypothetical protein
VSDRKPLAAAYSPDEHRPLGGYALLAGLFGAALAGGVAGAERSGRRIPERVRVGDVVLAGVATHKVSRLLAKDKVTSFLRAPFTRYEESSGHGEVEEHARGRGIQMAIGELLLCPYCVSQWVAGGFAVGLVAAPRPTRLLMAMWTAQTIADAAQLAYVAAEERV